MSLYPKQLQFYTENSEAVGPGNTRVRNAAPGELGVISDGYTPSVNITVNALLFDIGTSVNGLDLTGATYSKRTRPEHRPFDSAFGQKVIFPQGVAITGTRTVNELIAILRAEYDIYRAKTATKTGLATSVKY
jgi:hypothetical protein